MKQLNLILTIGLVATAATAVAAAPVGAQQSHRDSAKKSAAVPADARPPKGMCRIWIDGVPAAQQPAPTDCGTAVKNRPTNGRVIFGDDYDVDSAKTNDRTKLPAGAKGFQGVKPPAIVLPKRPDSR